jgi:putative redox protein
MEIRLDRVNDKVHLLARNDSKNEVHIDGAPGVGGEGAGFRPMQLLLAALASCTTMDLVPILEKQRQRLEDLRIRVSGERVDGTPSPFESIHLHFELAGTIDDEKAGRAIELAVEKYCSVKESLHPEIAVTYSHEIRSEGLRE